jgi:hypothetical protein
VKNCKLNGMRISYPNINPVAKNSVEKPTIKMAEALWVSLNTGEIKHHV